VFLIKFVSLVVAEVTGVP